MLNLKYIRDLIFGSSKTSVVIFEHISKNQRWVAATYQNGQKYYMIAYGGVLITISEYVLGLLITIASYLGVVMLRRLIKRLRLKKKFKKALIRVIQKIRSGSEFNGVVSYEEESNINDFMVYSLIKKPDLTNREEFVKDILRKCFSARRYYKITNPTLLSIINKMVDFKNEKTKIISYDAFAIALIIFLDPTTSLMYNQFQTLVPSVIMQRLPLYSGLFLGISSGILVGGSSSILNGLITLIINYSATYRMTSLLRTSALIDCTNYRKELPVTQQRYLEGTEAENQISYVREAPEKNDIFVSTSPNSDLHYQKDFEVDTMDGRFKQCQNLNGDKSIEWLPNRKENSPTSNYIPLKSRTKTLDDLRQLDSSINRESASKSIKAAQQQQLISIIIDESIE